MERGGWQRTWVRILMTAMTVAAMALIFCFSTEPADQSDVTSGRISRRVIAVIYPDYSQKTVEEQQTIYDSVQHTVRKAAHFTEYMLLGLLIRFCLESWFGNRGWSCPVSWATGTFYAGTDEFHQILIDGRSGQLADVMIDSGGVLIGTLIAHFIIRTASRKQADTRKDV